MKAQQLKNSVLQLAVQGKLVPQDPNDEPASFLLKKIRAEKEQLIKAGKIKKEKPLPPITEDEIPFDVPESWEWVRLDGLGQIVGGGTPKTDKSENWINGKIPWLTPADMKNVAGKYVSYGERNITENGLNNSSAQIMPENTIIYSSRAPIGYIAIASNPLCTNQGFKSVIPFFVEIVHYLYFSLIQRTPDIQSRASGTTFKEISGTEFGQTLIPLPPLEEQHRIVARIEELLPYIDAYDTAEQKLTALNTAFPDQLKKSILQAAVQGKLVKQDPNDEPASVLLEQIRTEKEQLIKEGKIKKVKPLPPVAEDEVPFDVPESWEWVRLGNVVYNHGQITPQTDFCYIDIGSIDNQQQRLNEQETTITASKAPSRARRIVKYGDILYSTVRPYLHNMCIIDREFSHTPIASTGFAVMACYKGLNNRYLFYFLLSPDFDNYANSNENSKGVAYPAINDARLYNALVPLPPLEEQHRIVAKCEELLSLVERCR